MNTGTLVFFCGKMGAGKSTLAQKTAKENNAVLLSEDDWLTALYPEQITSLKDYVNYADKLKAPMKKLAQSILLTGTDVVMDFPANTINQRQWFRSIFSEIDAPHCLIYLERSDETCLKQLQQRRIEQPERAVMDTAEVFKQVTQYFSIPSTDEGFTIKYD